MMRSWYERPAGLLLLTVGVVLLFSRCDLPTQAPDFSFTTGVRTPVIFDQTFVFIGPGEEGIEALIDTTSTTFDSLFTVDPADQSLYIVEEVDDFDLGALDGVLPEVDLSPVNVEVDLGDLTDQQFDTSFETELGVFENPGQALPTAPLAVQGGAAVVTIPADQIFPAPEFDLIETDRTSTPQEIVLTGDADGVNAFRFVLTNGLDVPLTDGTGNPSAPPQIILERGDGTEIARGRFDRVPAPGASAEARVSVAGQTMAGDLAYRFDISTPDGFAPIENNPERVTVASELEPLRYSETVLSSIPAQDDIDASQSEINLAGEVDFSGIVASSGQITITITNNLPIPVRIDDLILRNLEAVDTYPADHVLLRTQLAGEIAPGATASLPVDLGQTGIAPRLAVETHASSDGLASTARLRASDGLDVAVSGDVQVERLFFRPDEESFLQSGTIDLDIDDVSFTPGVDFIELKQGTLRIEELVNELDLTLSTLQISLPSFRVPPYGPGDSLVIRFEGLSDEPGAYKFQGIAAKSTLRDLAIDLSDLRIYPDGHQLTYHVSALSQAASKTSALNVTDRIRASIGARDLQLRHVAASVEPFSVSMTEDADGDGRLELLSEDEAVVASFGDFSELSRRLDGLQLAGSALTFSLTTNLAAGLDVYGAIVGTTADGERVFLSGRGDYAVAPSDSLVGRFTLGGVPLPAEQLIRFRLSGADGPDQPRTNTIVLDGDNSTVDAFISKLPQNLRFVGKAVVASDGRVELREPFELDAAIHANIPLNIGGRFTVVDTVEADLSDLADLTRPDETVTLEQATLRVSYDNGIPLGISAQMDVLGPQGDVLLTLPNTEDGVLRLAAAPTDEAGLATDLAAGEIEFPVSRDDLRTLAEGERIQLRLTVQPSGDEVARLRATDRLRIALKGDIRLNVQAGQ
ncbi:hypothetical protein AWN76_016845 [Rhodothermaceae bacterium RA]|nr:hypothetical protein AWN76_016845 [Rhodothermaceae bacterium RA]